MIKYCDQGTVWINGKPQAAPDNVDKTAGHNGTIAYQILNAHRSESDDGIFQIFNRAAKCSCSWLIGVV